MFRKYFVVGLSHETLTKSSKLAWFFTFQSCALHVALSWVSFSWGTCKLHLFILLSLSLHTLSYSSLTIKNPHKYKEIWLKKLQSNLTWTTKNSCKLQLYNNKSYGKLTVFSGVEEGSMDFEVFLLPETLNAMVDDAEFMEALAS